MTEYPVASPITISYTNLHNPDYDIESDIQNAFGIDGLGLIVITDIPHFAQKRFDLLKLGHTFANLPEETKEKYVQRESKYSFGWSHGKEALSQNVFDFYKGSYYNNPNYDVPTEDEVLIEKYPEVCLPNIWPTDDLPELEGAFKELGGLITEVGIQLLVRCDRFVKEKLGDDYQEGLLADVIRETRASKARLLHYFPVDKEGERGVDSWCGWHNDHSLLTGLCPAMFHNEESDEPECDNPDPNSGLYAKSRSGQIEKVKIPRNALGFQIGLTAQVLTGGSLRATPHCVRACKYPESVTHSRSTLAVFMQPGPTYEMKKPDVEYESSFTEHFENGMTFGDFGKSTIEAYYNDDN